ncbi:BCCT family transporter [Halomonas halocynthiae]|uniref:BCCT family transporter n=1 Tax=Halomonas halocynthiae TaxID=176290 RepID=UPI0004171BD3|nr:BCCT family transporter [Halomonas halocynthiae]
MTQDKQEASPDHPDKRLMEEGIPSPSGDSGLIDTDYQVGQDNFKGSFTVSLDIHSKVFSISAVVIVLFVILTLSLQNDIGPIFTAVNSWLTGNLSWFFILTSNVFVVVCLGLILSPYGRVRLGGVDAKPDHSYISWLAMLFAAGMGIGLMFYGVAEPMSHFSSALGGVQVGEDGLRTDWAPLGGAEGDMLGAAKLGMSAALVHWAATAWAIYAVVALALALFSFNKGLPLTMRSILYPVLGERIWGWPGHLVDILAVFATLFGLSTSLGFGAEQATAGLNYLFGISDGNVTKVFLILGITGVALVSVVVGLDAGVKRLSELNMLLAFLLLMFVIIAGPTLIIVTGFFENLKNYFMYLPALSNPFGREDLNYSQGWSAFFWAWWISWSPFVGMFIARVSRGRTVREFLIAVLVVPTLVCVIWFTTFGGTAIDQVINGYTAVQDAALELKLFVMLEQLPLTLVTSVLGIMLVVVFFITSSDSGSLVIDAITAGGKINSPTTQRVFWASIEGLIAIALLLGGGLAALQAMVVATGLPFSFVLLVGVYGIVKGLHDEPR